VNLSLFTSDEFARTNFVFSINDTIHVSVIVQVETPTSVGVKVNAQLIVVTLPEYELGIFASQSITKPEVLKDAEVNSL
jgi:hypothetical protein